LVGFSRGLFNDNKKIPGKANVLLSFCGFGVDLDIGWTDFDMFDYWAVGSVGKGERCFWIHRFDTV
jgi:hypothetical protein